MKKLNFLVVLVIFLSLTALKADKPAYSLFDKNGKEVKYKRLLKAAAEADIVLFGELHNNPISHWLQFELTQDLFDVRDSALVLGAEMLESDNQMILDEYLAGTIRRSNFEDEAKLWNNYSTDYKPMLEFAKEKNLKFVASNIPRRYASLVHKKGFEGLEELSESAQLLVAPLPVAYDPELPGYKAMMDMMSGMGKGHANDNLPKAQAIKDATMAHFILENWTEGKLLMHYNGCYHSNNFEGIYWYLKKQNPELKILTISTVEQEFIENLVDENEGLADFTICIPEDMIKTY